MVKLLVLNLPRDESSQKESPFLAKNECERTSASEKLKRRERAIKWELFTARFGGYRGLY